MPDEDTSRIVVSVELPPGATLEDTRVTTDQMVKILKTIPEVKSVFVLGGSTPTGGLEVRKSSLFVHLVPKTERTLPQKALKVDHLRQARRHSRHARLVRQRARRARAVVLHAVARRRRR